MMEKNITIPKFAKGGFVKPLYVGGDNQKENRSEEGLNEQLEKRLQKGKLCGFNFDELRGLK